MSCGSRSTVHWMRLKLSIGTCSADRSACANSPALPAPGLHSIDCARARASEVLPTPWESARITCPPAILAAMRYSNVRGSM